MLKIICEGFFCQQLGCGVPPCLPPVMLSARGGPTSGRGVPPPAGEGEGGRGEGRERGAGDILVQLPYTALPHGASA